MLQTFTFFAAADPCLVVYLAIVYKTNRDLKKNLTQGAVPVMYTSIHACINYKCTKISIYKYTFVNTCKAYMCTYRHNTYIQYIREIEHKFNHMAHSYIHTFIHIRISRNKVTKTINTHTHKHTQTDRQLCVC